jgi:hypothetical protein
MGRDLTCPIPIKGLIAQVAVCASRRYPHFDVVVRLAWSSDPKSYAGGSVATVRVSHVGQVVGDDPE